MTTAARPTDPDPDEEPAVRHRNEVLLAGVVASTPRHRTLANGQTVVTFRLDVTLDPADGGGRDSFECTVHHPRTRAAALAWVPGDTLELSGVIRRRFYRVGNGSRPFTVVEVARARRVPDRVRRRRKRG